MTSQERARRFLQAEGWGHYSGAERDLAAEFEAVRQEALLEAQGVAEDRYQHWLRSDHPYLHLASEVCAEIMVRLRALAAEGESPNLTPSAPLPSPRDPLPAGPGDDPKRG